MSLIVASRLNVCVYQGPKFACFHPIADRLKVVHSHGYSPYNFLYRVFPTILLKFETQKSIEFSHFLLFYIFFDFQKITTNINQPLKSLRVHLAIFQTLSTSSLYIATMQFNSRKIDEPFFLVQNFVTNNFLSATRSFILCNRIFFLICVPATIEKV